MNRAVERLRLELRETLADELAGVCLTGSLALGGFDQASSDVDVLVATVGVLPQATLDRLAGLHAALKAAGGWTARLEVVYLPLATLRRYDPADTGRYPIAAGDRDFALGGQAQSWVLDRWIAREHGLAVAGPAPRTLIDPIGPGTRALCRLSRGDDLNVLGPLGNGFRLDVERPLLVGGGIGIAPLPYLSESLGGPPAILGFRSDWHAEAAALGDLHVQREGAVRDRRGAEQLVRRGVVG